MPVDYELFSVAGPPRTGLSWLLRACQLAGLGSGRISDAVVPFAPDADPNAYKIGIVRNPFDWLISLHAAFCEGRLQTEKTVGEFAIIFLGTLREEDPSPFLRSYLRTAPGSVGRLFDRYKTDARWRLEDMPWKLISFLEMLDVPRLMARRVLTLKKQNAGRRIGCVPTSLRREVLVAESAFCEELDYY